MPVRSLRVYESTLLDRQYPRLLHGETAVGLVKSPITDMFAPLTDDSIPSCVSQL
jgi:hypothetical protein